MKILIFDIYADYGCFKKFYTTSSILTYDFPPKTALIGVIGSILGYKRKSKEMKELRDIKIGIKILNQIKKIHQGINWLNTKVKSIKIDPIITSFLEPIAQFSVKDFYGFVGINKNKPSNLQLLKNPKFRIFISNENFDEYNTLVKSVKKQLYHFSPYLGQTEFLCSLDFFDEVNSECLECKINSQKIQVDSVIPQNFILKDQEKYYIKISEKSSILVDQLPFEYENDITKFHKIVYDKSGAAILTLVKKYYKISSSSLNKDYNIILF